MSMTVTLRHGNIPTRRLVAVRVRRCRPLVQRPRCSATGDAVAPSDNSTNAEPTLSTQNTDVLLWSGRQRQSRVSAPSGANPIVILPGFGNNSVDYLEPFGDSSSSIVTHLQERGWKVFVVPVVRKDWFQVARALLTINFWRGQCTTHPGYTWYLDRVASTVETALKETGAQQVDLVCHSAGGWLGRAFLGDRKYQQPAEDLEGARPNRHVRTVVTLGTPQAPPPADKVRDMTGGALGWVNTTYPGAFFAPQGVRYICVAGRTVRGNVNAPRKPRRSPGAYSYDSYSMVCGEGDGVVGDAVVPLKSALLSGATNIILEGVWHSMSKIGTFEERSQVVWYGSEEVLDCWLQPLAHGSAAESALASAEELEELALV